MADISPAYQFPFKRAGICRKGAHIGSLTVLYKALFEATILLALPPPFFYHSNYTVWRSLVEMGSTGLINFDLLFTYYWDGKSKSPGRGPWLKRRIINSNLLNLYLQLGNSSLLSFSFSAWKRAWKMFSNVVHAWLKNKLYLQECVCVCSPQQNLVYYQIMGIRSFPCRNVRWEGKQLLQCEEGRRRLKGVNGG